MRPRRHSYGRGGRSAAAAVLLVLCLCVTGVFLLLLHGSSPPLDAEGGKEQAAAAGGGGGRHEEPMVLAEVEEAPLPPGNARVAFLFIARNRLPLDLVWDAFFRGDNEGRFSIFVHSRPGFVLTRATTRSRFFYNRQVNNSVQVDWGEASMIEAERILLSHALKDPFNERFVFVSDSCVPLYNFNYTYDYIMSASTSFVDSFADTKQGRYNPRMDPIIPVENWRKGSQWAVLIKKHAEVVVYDDVVLPEFKKHCRRRPLPEFWRDWDKPIVLDVNIWPYSCDMNCSLLRHGRHITAYQMSTMFKHCLHKMGLKKSLRGDQLHIAHGIYHLLKIVKGVDGIL
ncbi:glycosyltransferase BC10-like isoform X2 [Triticum dicoccoides]|uniref:glycosyltransferase BC10-like isoform X2 n=1 Tax=Triticum dicoccoides TaxID=85692 RepID=UPI00188F7A5D|nr:glycosyltransferase BC10-like isoform X2 [Triticum dicoccoides]